MKHPEDDLQQSCIKWFKLQYAKYAGRISHAPNGGFRNVREAAKFKAMGVLPGYPDLFLSVPVHEYHGAYFEIKCGKNELSKNQEAFIKEHEKDYSCHICYTLDEFIRAVNNYLK